MLLQALSSGKSLAQADLKAVIIETAGELVVVLPLEGVELVGVLLGAEELGQVPILRVNLELVKGFAFAPVHVVVGVGVLLRLLQLVEH